MGVGGEYGDDYSLDFIFYLVMVKVWLKNESFFFVFLCIIFW